MTIRDKKNGMQYLSNLIVKELVTKEPIVTIELDKKITWFS